ncbi:MAG: hypothetical protein QOJ11_1542 [Frankiales bacterium]|jgi:hypothetical protein|nr:hypothetical protein [Frankiales bacterium]
MAASRAADASADRQLREIGTALLDRVDELAEAMAARIREEVEFYRTSDTVPLSELRKSTRGHLLFVLESLGAGEWQLDTTQAAATGRRRAVDGVPLATIMEAYRVGSRMIWLKIAEHAEAQGTISMSSLLRATSDIWLVQEEFTQAMSGAYREEMSAQVLNREHERSALVEALISGRITDTTAMWEAADVLRVSREGPYVLVAAELLDVGRPTFPGIEAVLRNTGIESAWRLMPDLQVGIVPIRRPDQLGLLVSALRRFPVTRVGISPAFNDLIGTPFALRCSRIALTGARLDREPITVFDESPLAVGAVASPDIMRRVSETVLAGLYELPTEERELLLDTLDAWLDKGGSASRAAEILFCHPNTVRHRLRRIEQRTGRSLTDPRQTTELCVALETARRIPHSP